MIIPTYIRSKGKHKIDYAYKDMYKSYKKHLKNSNTLKGNSFKNTSFNISLKKHNDILTDFHSIIFDKIVNTNFNFKLPYRLGQQSIKKYKQGIRTNTDGSIVKGSVKIDYVATKLLWAKDEDAKLNKYKIYNFNEHSDGYRYIYVWEKRDCAKAIGIFNYNFVLSRTNKRQMCKTIKEGEVDFYISTKYKKNFYKKLLTNGTNI